LIGAEIEAGAQLIAARESPVAMGHIHLSVSDVGAQRDFWKGQLGAEETSLGPIPVMKLPNLLVLLREGDPEGGSEGSSVDHIGLQVPDVNAVVVRLQAGGYPIITRQVIPPAEGDVFYIENQDARVAFVLAPDQVKIELFENRQLGRPIANHHVHFATTEIAATQAWYADVFGAVPGQRGSFAAADLPGVNLTFSASASQPVGTRGRALDHIGFEVRNLERLCDRLQAVGIELDRPYSVLEGLGGLGSAFLTDPWGTYIELTEGLDDL
jgi:catechol 2,3-dioxygenase-like lactoylglutathione lyase family enzyme